MPHSSTAKLSSPAARATGDRFVFVYGTLRRGGANDITRLQPPPRFVGRASILGVMYHLGHYPGVLLGGTGVIWGEIYEISQQVERQLDEIEQVWPQPTGEYAKREIPVQLLDPSASGQCRPAEAGATFHCIVYEINPDRVAGRASIESGDWVLSAAPPILVEIAAHGTPAEPGEV